MMTKRQKNNHHDCYALLSIIFCVLFNSICLSVYSFSSSSISHRSKTFLTKSNLRKTNFDNELLKRRHNLGALFAGGFEWEDPTDEFDQGVENPFKGSTDEGDMETDPACLLAPRLTGVNIYFIGMMGSGKTTIGNAMAQRMGSYRFLDTDSLIEKVTNATIPEIFAEVGEEEFRNIEVQVLDQVQSFVRCVVSTGGGIVCRRNNWSKLQTGIVVWLDVEPETIMDRIKGTDRPLLQGDDPLGKLKSLLDERRSLYSAADLRLVVTPSMDTNSTVDALIKELHQFIDDNPPMWKKAKAKAQEEGLDWVK